MRKKKKKVMKTESFSFIKWFKKDFYHRTLIWEAWLSMGNILYWEKKCG